MGIGIRIENCARSTTRRRPRRRAAAASPSPPSAPAAQKDKKKKFEVVALDGISLEIRAGEIFGLLGPNGAGKSTTIGILTTRTQPTSGRAFIGEFDVWQQQVKAKRLIGVVPQRPNLDFALTAREILLFHGAYFGQSARERDRRADELLEKFKLTDRADHMVRGFSGGMMQRLSIARAMMHDPEVLFLDEPSRRPRSADAPAAVGDHPRLQPAAARPSCSPRTTWTKPTRCATASPSSTTAASSPRARRGAEGLHPRRLPAAPALRPRAGRPAGAVARRCPASAKCAPPTTSPADVYADRGGPLIAAIVNAAQAAGVELRDVHIAEPSLETLFLHHTGRSLRD